MELLSDKLLGRVFSYLDFRSLMAADMVCKRWQNVINKQQLYLKISKRESPPGLNDDCLETFSSSKELHLTNSPKVFDSVDPIQTQPNAQPDLHLECHQLMVFFLT